MPQDAIRYEVSMLRANAHYFDVALEFPVPESASSGSLHLAMPSWTPGHYVIEDFSRNVLGVKASDAETGSGLEVTKLTKSQWSVAVQGAKRVRVEYAAYAFAYGVVSSYIDDQHALVNGASVFLYPEGMEGNPVTVTLNPYPGWNRVSTGLEKASEFEFTAPNYDVLVDSPMEVGNQDVRTFVVGGAEYSVSMFGPSTVDREGFVADLKKVVENTVPIFGDVPYKRYVFLVNFTDSLSQGLEHLNSTMCMVQRFRLLPREEYNVMMGLFSHEFFHAWNVKRLRPVGLGPFDYSTETYTKSLWVAEGLTSYFDDLIIRRAGLYSVEEYLDVFATNINLLKSLPGSRFQSAQEASFDTWVKYYKPDENSPNVASSYYVQGAVVGWMLDMTIRKGSGGKRCLDDVMRKMYADKYLKEKRGYSDEEFEACCAEVGGQEVEEVFDSRVRGREDVDYDRYLGYAGLRLESKDTSKKERGFLGVRLNVEGGRTTVRTGLSGSPAEAMGLAANDEIIAVGDLRVSSDRLGFYIQAMKPGDELKLTVARNGRLMELSGKVGRRPAFEYRIQPLAEATGEQKALFKGWMLQEWKAELKYPEYQRSPDRKQALDYV